jgi:cytochrome c-type protein NapC
VSVVLLPGLCAAQAPGPDDAFWAKAKSHEVVVFPPGQSSWEWDLTESDHSGAPKIRKGKSCGACHLDEENKIGKLIASGKKIEPDPIGSRPSIPLDVKVARDDESLLLRIEWPDVEKPGGKPMDPKRDARVTVMLGDDSDKGFTIAGCWATCHDDMAGMPSAEAGSDRTKYLAVSRTKLSRKGGDDNFKSAADLAALRKEGRFLEYWSASLRGNGLAGVTDGTILERRQKNETPTVQAAATKKGGRWVVTMRRPLEPGTDKMHDIVAGKTYYVGIALHDDHSDGRHHHVSFERTLALDSSDADLNVKEK